MPWAPLACPSSPTGLCGLHLPFAGRAVLQHSDLSPCPARRPHTHQLPCGSRRPGSPAPAGASCGDRDALALCRAAALPVQAVPSLDVASGLGSCFSKDSARGRRLLHGSVCPASVFCAAPCWPSPTQARFPMGWLGRAWAGGAPCCAPSTVQVRTGRGADSSVALTPDRGPEHRDSRLFPGDGHGGPCHAPGNAGGLLSPGRPRHRRLVSASGGLGALGIFKRVGVGGGLWLRGETRACRPLEGQRGRPPCPGAVSRGASLCPRKRKRAI